MDKPEPTPGELAATLVADVGFLSTSLPPEVTGVVGAVIWCFAGEFTRDEAHLGPRIRVALGAKLTVDAILASVSVTLAIPPQVLGHLPTNVETQALAFIRKNRDLLFDVGSHRKPQKSEQPGLTE